MATPLETAEIKTDGQTSTISTKADFSKVEALNSLNNVLIKQPFRKKECFIQMCGCEVKNLYQVIAVNQETKTQQQLFTLQEESDCCLRNCCGANRPLELNATYPEQIGSDPLFVIDKPYRCGCCCCDASQCMGRSYMECFIGGVCIGSVKEKCLCNCRVSYGVYDENETLLCSIERCACYCECMDVKFEILTPDGEETGKTISKLYGGFLKEMFTTNDNFLVEFPDFMNNCQRKLLMITAAMMIEFKYVIIQFLFQSTKKMIILMQFCFCYEIFRHFEQDNNN